MQINRDSILAEFNQRLATRGASLTQPTSDSGVDFGQLMLGGIQSVNDAQVTSQSQIDQLLSGGDIDSAEVVTGIQKADMAFRMLLQIRNKLMKAYEDIQAIHV